MESSNQNLETLRDFIPQTQQLQKQEVYHMTRIPVTNRSLKKSKHKKKGKDAESIEISQTLKLAARGFGTNHRLNIEGESMAQNLLQREEANKKKGIFFLCC